MNSAPWLEAVLQNTIRQPSRVVVVDELQVPYAGHAGSYTRLGKDRVEDESRVECRQKEKRTKVSRNVQSS